MSNLYFSSHFQKIRKFLNFNNDIFEIYLKHILVASIRSECIENNTKQIRPDGSCECYNGITGPRCEQIEYDLECDQSYVSVTAKM